jgi:hypothetical protein
MAIGVGIFRVLHLLDLDVTRPLYLLHTLDRQFARFESFDTHLLGTSSMLLKLYAVIHFVTLIRAELIALEQ